MSRPKKRDTLTKEAYCPLCETSFPVAETVCPSCDVPLIILEQAEDELVGQELDGRYLLKEKLGSGGMGAVYRAVQLAVERDVVIKVIRPDLSNDMLAAKRFLREAKMATRLTHPHTVSVFEFGQTKNGLLFLAMEYLRGQTLHDLLERDGPLDHERACGIVEQILDGLAAAHASSIVHRDLKPANIVILDDPPGKDFVKILDFGLAKSLSGKNTTTEAGMMMGTPAYMPPEMIFGGDVDLRSDLYATGVILYELLRGKPPFEQTEIQELLTAQAYKPPPKLDSTVPAPIAHVVYTLMQKEPDRRFPSASEARDALMSALAVADRTILRAASHPGEISSVERTPLPEPVYPRRRAAPTVQARPSNAKRTRLFAVGGAAVVAAIALMVAISAGGSSEPDGEEPPAGEEPAASEATKGSKSSSQPDIKKLAPSAVETGPPKTRADAKGAELDSGVKTDPMVKVDSGVTDRDPTGTDPRGADVDPAGADVDPNVDPTNKSSSTNEPDDAASGETPERPENAVDKKAADKKAADTRPVKKAADTRPVKKKPVKKKPVKKKPVEKKPVEKVNDPLPF